MKFFDIENIAFTLGGTGVSFLELIGVIAGLTCVVMAGRNSKYNFWVGYLYNILVPLVIRTTEEALKAIPDSMREGSRALGATKLQTIWHVILPMGMPNIITGLILALGRVSGETAPILFTCAAYFLPQLPTSILDQCMALPYHLYVISTSGTDMEAQLPLAYGTALVLIVIILLVNLLANALRKYFEKKVKMN